jgi:pantoate--beta-alanine ligase
MLVAARLGNTRLLDNIAIDIGVTAGADGRYSVASGDNHELPWRN